MLKNIRHLWMNTDGLYLVDPCFPQHHVWLTTVQSYCMLPLLDGKVSEMCINILKQVPLS